MIRIDKKQEKGIAEDNALQVNNEEWTIKNVCHSCEINQKAKNKKQKLKTGWQDDALQTNK